MLVLSRRKNEKLKICVGETVIDVIVVAVVGNKVRLGFEAPSEVAIHRQEVWERIEAGQGPPDKTLRAEEPERTEATA